MFLENDVEIGGEILNDFIKRMGNMVSTAQDEA